jgi:hypothetical protein
MHKRVQVLMEPDEAKRLEAIALQRRTSVGDLMRQAVRERYLGAPDQRKEAAKHIALMEVDLGSVQDMEGTVQAARGATLVNRTPANTSATNPTTRPEAESSEGGATA